MRAAAARMRVERERYTEGGGVPGRLSLSRCSTERRTAQAMSGGKEEARSRESRGKGSKAAASRWARKPTAIGTRR